MEQLKFNPAQPEQLKLEPCPFCGGEAVVRDIPDGNWSWCRVQCTNCLSQTELYTSKKVAINVWNRRATQPNAPLTPDELKQMDGEPVWVERFIKGRAPFYGIVVGNMVKGFDPNDGRLLNLEISEEGAYDLAWLAYRHNPGKETI